MAEKLICTLAPIRVSETLERSLMRSAARADRTLADYIRRALELHEWGHAGMVDDQADADNADRALQRNARRGG